MPYNVRYTDITKTPITVDDQTLNAVATSISFVGKNYAGYSQAIAENFLHLLENFARTTPPPKPTPGQLWYNTSTGADNQLKLYDGTNWVAAGNVKKATDPPPTSIIGDLWVDTDNQQLYLFNGSSWILVGPQYSTGQKTGAEVELISDSVGNNIRPCLTLFVNDQRVAIISEFDFVPKSAISGFPIIKQGINLSTVNFNSSVTGNKFWGIAEKAEALLIGSAAVAATNFLRSDTLSTTNFGFNVRNNAGISIGGDLALSISIDSNAVVFYNKISGSSIDFRVNTGVETPIVMRVDSSQRVGINKTNPDESLDVSGNIKTNGKIIVTGIENSTDLSTGSFITSGGASITKNLFVGEGIDVSGQTRIQDLLPKIDSTYNIGTSTNRWNTIFADNMVADTFTGNFSGFLTGNISGSAVSLVSNTEFSLGDELDEFGNIIQASDVVSSGINFNGSTTSGKVVLTAIVASSFISNKDEVLDSFDTDEFIISRTGNLRRTTKETLFENVPTVPIGAIMPFAGNIIPSGYLLCDGSEQQIASYPELFATIGYTYKSLSLLTGIATFALPDLRGRFALGRDNMGNSGDTPADRVTDVAADSVGGVGGNSEVTLTRNNLPDHVHDLKGDAGTQFFAFRPAAGAPPDSNAQVSNGPTAVDQGQLMVDSGGIYTDDLPSSTLSVPVTITNHYLAINYIIFTGRIT